MLLIRPANCDFVFPAGRYLVVKGQAHDFTVAGPIMEAANASRISKRLMARFILDAEIHEPHKVSFGLPSRLGWWSGRGGRSCHRDPQGDQVGTSAHHCGVPWQVVCFHVHTDLPARPRPSCGAGKPLDLPRGRPVADKRRQANRHGGEWRLFRKYYLPAGVSMNWLKRIAPMIKEALWQTGGDLISAKTGIVMYMYALSDRTERVVAAQNGQPG
jgi:hypothetical protein